MSAAGGGAEMDVTSLLLNLQSQHDNVRVPAEQQLEAAKASNLVRARAACSPPLSPRRG